MKSREYILEVIVFVSGAVVMILELVGSRVLAPYVGTSIIVWTSLIGIILGSLSLGYWLGGRVADRWPDYKVLSAVLFAAGLLIGIVSYLKSDILSAIQRNFEDIRVGSVMATLLLFAPASVLLGMVLPFSIRLSLKRLKSAGETAGNLFAISTVGSIVGTFSAGFFLIAYLGHTKTLVLLSILLLLISFLAIFRAVLKLKSRLFASVLLLTIIACLMSIPIEPIAFVDVDTLYSRVLLEKHLKDGRPVLSMRIGSRGYQSAMFLDEDDDLVAEYTKYFRLVSHFKPDLERVLMIGGAGYSYPKDFLKHYPQAKIDVVEIDPGITELARRYFRLKENPHLAIYHQDGREFLNQVKSRYDVIFIDAYEGDASIPFQLTTLEAIKDLYSALEEDGVVFLNIFSSIEGTAGKFLRAELETYESVFSQAYLFPVKNYEDPFQTQNVILVVLKSEKEPSFNNDNEELDGYLHHMWTGEVSQDMPILTDDYAPVAYYLLDIYLEGR